MLEVQEDTQSGASATVHSNGVATKLAGGVTGKGFQPGRSGNPSGRAKLPDAFKELARKQSKRALERIIELVESTDERVAIMAAKEVLDRAYGKTKPAEDEDDNAKKNVTINILRYTEPNAGNHASAPVEAQAISVRTLALS